MRKNPADRYSSAAEMRDDLKRVATGQAAVGGAYGGAAGADHTSVLPPVEQSASTRPTVAPQMRPVPQRRTNPWLWVGPAAVLLLVGLGVAYARFGGGGGVTVPALSGLTEEQAKTTLEAGGLALGEITTENSDTVELGLIISQDPEAGAEVEEGAAVNIVVSMGIAQVTVPDLTNMPEATAIEALRSTGDLEYDKTTDENSAAIAKGLVIRTEPAAGTPVPKGTRVILFVSAGIEQVKVPNVVGQAQAQAKSTLEARGTRGVGGRGVQRHRRQRHRDDRRTPSPNVVLEAGSTVTIAVSKGPEVIIVPEVRDKPEAEARSIITAAGLVPKVVYVDAPEDGFVINQFPIAGASAKRGDQVELEVGKVP